MDEPVDRGRDQRGIPIALPVLFGIAGLNDEGSTWGEDPVAFCDRAPCRGKARVGTILEVVDYVVHDDPIAGVVLNRQFEDRTLLQPQLRIVRHFFLCRPQHSRVEFHAFDSRHLAGESGQVVPRPASGVKDGLFAEGPGPAGQGSED
ncbi:MAG: hypothetical protein OSB39_05440 [Opitutales bacterium]|nr:hypothetical protein [Opitutales bacterium]